MIASPFSLPSPSVHFAAKKKAPQTPLSLRTQAGQITSSALQKATQLATQATQLEESQAAKFLKKKVFGNTTGRDLLKRIQQAPPNLEGFERDFAQKLAKGNVTIERAIRVWFIDAEINGILEHHTVPSNPAYVRESTVGTVAGEYDDFTPNLGCSLGISKLTPVAERALAAKA